MEDLIIETEDGAFSCSNITLGDVLVFVTWMNQAEEALNCGEILPPLLFLDSDAAKSCIRLFQRLNEPSRHIEEKRSALEATVTEHEVQMGQLVSQLHWNLALLYENLGQSQKAEEVRRRAEGLHIR